MATPPPPPPFLQDVHTDALYRTTVSKRPIVPPANRSSALALIDAVVCPQDPRPPAVEYMLVQPYSLYKLPFSSYGIAWNSFGHAAVRYTLPSGEQKVFNIDGERPGVLVEFFSPEEYLFGTANPQGGIHTRDIVSVRVERLGDDKLLALDRYYTELAARHSSGQAKFDLLFGVIYRAAQRIFPSLAERGNCAWWTSSGLAAVGLCSRSTWPKSIFIDIFENAERSAAGSHDNVTVVSYVRPRNVEPANYGVDAVPLKAVAPLQSLRSFLYYDLERFAHVVVRIDDSDPNAPLVVAERTKSPAGPNPWRNHVNDKGAIVGSVIVSLAIIRRHLLARRIRAP